MIKVTKPNIAGLVTNKSFPSVGQSASYNNAWTSVTLKNLTQSEHSCGTWNIGPIGRPSNLVPVTPKLQLGFDRDDLTSRDRLYISFRYHF